jgi:hypothetical protein
MAQKQGEKPAASRDSRTKKRAMAGRFPALVRACPETCKIAVHHRWGEWVASAAAASGVGTLKPPIENGRGIIMRMCMQPNSKGDVPDIWADTGFEKVRLHEIEDHAFRTVCKSLERGIHDTLRSFRCPVHGEGIADVVIANDETRAVRFDVYGCCPDFEHTAEVRLITHTGQYPAVRPNPGKAVSCLSLAVSPAIQPAG